MEDFWNTSETTPATLDNFFDEESDVTWTGISTSISQSSIVEDANLTKNEKRISIEDIKLIGSSSNLSNSIFDNISISSDSVLTESSSTSKLRSVKAIGDKIESWKPSIKWKNSESNSCLQCSTKEEEIHQLKSRLERAFARRNVTLPPQETVRRMVLGQPYSLESYKLLEDKRTLLDEALLSMDTSSVVAVVLFLKNTLKKHLFQKEITKRPVAANAYITYLKRRSENTEALELLGILGKTEESSLLRYQMAIQSHKPQVVVQKLTNLLQNNLKDGSHEAKMVKQHLDLLELQLPIDAVDCSDKSNAMLVAHPRVTALFDLPLLTTLYYCSMYHWQAGESASKSPLYLRKHFSIPEKQFLWTVIRARARVKHWPLPTDLENLLTSKGLLSTFSSMSGYLSSGKVVKNALPLDRVVDTLASVGAPSHVLSAYISLMESNDDKLKLALKYKCHSVIIEAYVNLKDRELLQNYHQQLTFGTSEYIKAEQALKNLK